VLSQAVYIAPWFALLTLFRTEKKQRNKETKKEKKRKEKRKEKKKVKRQYSTDRNSNSLKSFQTLAKQRKIKLNQLVSAVLCGSVSIINFVPCKITT
jgi:cell division protein FtsI/penicillin-binding protein 2